jgi:hypothetical protein
MGAQRCYTRRRYFPLTVLILPKVQVYEGYRLQVSRYTNALVPVSLCLAV